MNTLKTGIQMSLVMGLFLLVGAALDGFTGMLIAFLFAAGFNLFAYWNSDRVLLSMYGARQVDESSAPELLRIVARLAQDARLPMPRVFISDKPQPNAFATGRNPHHAAVCVTSGLLARVTNKELAAVIAHELGHVRHRDTLTMTITAVITSALGMLANFDFFMGSGINEERGHNLLNLISVLLATILEPIVALFAQSAISYSREFEADKAGAEITGRPLWLAAALGKIENAMRDIENTPADANSVTTHMFIVNPLRGGISGTFASHPSTEERIARLRAMCPLMRENGSEIKLLAATPQRGYWG